MAMRTVLTTMPRLGVLTQVERGQHAEGGDEERHEERKHNGADDGAGACRLPCWSCAAPA